MLDGSGVILIAVPNGIAGWNGLYTNRPWDPATNAAENATVNRQVSFHMRHLLVA